MALKNFGKFLFGSILLFSVLATPVSVLAIGASFMPKDSSGSVPMDTISTSILSSTQAAQANPVSAPPAEAAEKTFQTVWSNIVSPIIKAILATVGYEAAVFLSDTMAYNTAVWLGSGAPGETPLVEILTGEDAWNQFGLDVAANAIGSLSESLNDFLDTDFNLCAPPNDFLRLSLQLGIVGIYDPPKPKCEWQSIAANWDGFVQGAMETAEDPSKYVLEQFAKSLEPGQNTLSYVVGVNMTVQNKVAEKKDVLFKEMLAKSGFKDVVDAVTGKVETPASLVENDAIKKLEAPDEVKAELTYQMLTSPDTWQQLGLRALSIFSNTLLSTWFDRIRKGLLAGVDYEEIDLSANLGGYSSWDRAASEGSFSGLISTTKLSLDNYNVLTEFVTCTASSTMTRQMNNCVMDANFMQAITKTKITEVYTVAAAIEEGYLHGDWPLYPPDDLKHNQDPLCYTYGYCYGNLVKLRKARIIPIGWELAASSDQNPAGTSITLQEVVDGFNYCNSDGKADAEHPWCHLIDPNWVLKYPSQQCLASMISDQTLGSMISGRSAACVDSPSCLSDDSEGNCESYGYCVRETNTWNFNGDSCPEEFSGCLAFTNADTSVSGAWLYDTLESGLCSADNAGCLWYRANKYFDDLGTSSEDDDVYSWLPTGEVYITDDRADDVLSFSSTGTATSRVSYSYDTDSDEISENTYSLYSFEDRIYFNNEVETCDSSAVGCSEVYPTGGDLNLNILRNPNFEDDEDNDGEADFWSATLGTSDDYDEEGSESYSGTDAYYLTSSSSLEQNNLPLQPGTFYTISVYAKGAAAGDDGSITLDLRASDNSAVSLAGYSTDCSLTDNDTVVLNVTDTESSDYSSYDCSFTTQLLTDEKLFIVADLSITPTVGSVYFDAVQLEVGPTASDFHVGYDNDTEVANYVILPPDWLGCQGEETDPEECDSYAAICSATDAGCSLYTPTDGDPAVPAVLAANDECPEVCAGYSTYKQEDTAYDTGEFPLYFIADTATQCSSADVGCDEFTNLETEEIETYSYLRACVTAEMTGDEAVYFTWEGSDRAGYQLVSYQLLKSDKSDAPCVNWQVTSEDTLTCDDPSSTTLPTTCDAHEDILTEPDCREFYDDDGDIHYRLYSETVAVSDDCTAYRKTDANETDCEDSGGFVTDAGECRYFIEPNESTVCPTEAAGCREYTGGGSRNSSEILTEYFEYGTYEDFEPVPATGTVSLAISNESVAVDGHSLRVAADSGEGLATVYDATTGEGPLAEELVAGKTFVLQFWAKGSGAISAALVENGGSGSVRSFVDSQTLSGGWELYEFGPIDTSSYEDFDETAILRFYSLTNGQVFYLDNIQLKQTEEDLTLIKDSWVTPAVCDETPASAPSDQYYLGCEEYTDQNDETWFIYQFSDLCSEAVVGCEEVYDTQNSESPYSEYYNLSCYSSTGAVVASATACDYDGEEVCTILAGYDNCQFDFDGNLQVPLPTNIKLGPEAVFVKADEVKYAVVDSTFACEADNAGCTEYGQPVFSQDRSVVESFESAYLLNQPDEYSSTLCADGELFCGEWASTQDGNFYFKDPGDQACEYKSKVTIGNAVYSGWFRAGTSEFCYGTGICSESGSGCSTDSDCGLSGGSCEITTGSYIIGGEVSGLWRNGDADFAGWAGTCDDQYDLCTEFVDPLATREETSVEGTSFFYLDNESLADSDRCNGQVSLLEGCVLFDDQLTQELSYSASPSYLVSEHADVFFGDEPRSLQDPISCDDPATDGDYTLTTGSSVNVCQQRCAYSVASSHEISNLAVDQGPTSDDGYTTYYGAACIYDTDCQLGQDSITNEDIEGTCAALSDNSTYAFENDTNYILKVYRDRECSEWLSCSSSYAAWDERTATWTDVCEEVGLCNEYDSAGGDGGTCSSWIEQDATTLDLDEYSGRDTSWYGLDYSGYAIPNQLPVELYEQFNIYPEMACYTSDGVLTADPPTPCDSVIDCSEETSGTGEECLELHDSQYRLVYAPVACEDDALNGTSCLVGFCTDTGRPCSDDVQCPSSGAECIIGYCEEASAESCIEDSDCDEDSDYLSCRGGFCTDLTTGVDYQESCFSTSDCSVGVCVPSVLSKTGACYNQSCLIGLDGQPFDYDHSEEKSCRGYPEISSPFPNMIVDSWLNPGDDETLDSGQNYNPDVQPYDFVLGFNDVNVCSPLDSSSVDDLVYGDECSCSYEKAVYGEEAAYRYFPLDTSKNQMLTGICLGGETSGAECSKDSDCNDIKCGSEDITNSSCSGVCQKLSKNETMFGWDGYCLERDSSVQLFGSSDNDYRACLTWLPVDLLTGSRDMYANDTEAGYGIGENIFYCSEVGMFADLYPLGAEINNETGEVEGMHYACASSFGVSGDACDYGMYGSNQRTIENANCQDNVACPSGYVGILGVCDQDADPETEQDSGVSYEDGGDIDGAEAELLCWDDNYDIPHFSEGAPPDEVTTDPYGSSIHDSIMDDIEDCPYFCIPENGYHIDGDDIGESCQDDLETLLREYDQSSPQTSDFSTSVYFAYDLFNTEDYWNGEYSDYTKFQDCVRRGIPIGDLDTTYTGHNEYGYDYWENPAITTSGDFKKGAYGIADRIIGTVAYLEENPEDIGVLTYDSGTQKPYLGCLELVKVSDISDGNKVWTNRLWALGTYTTSGNFAYTYSSAPIPFGEAKLENYFSFVDEGDGYYATTEFTDSWPLPVGSCDTSDGIETIDGCSGVYAYPGEAQYAINDNESALVGDDTAYNLSAPYEELTSEEWRDAFDLSVDEFDTLGTSNDSTGVSVSELLQQIFAMVYSDVWKYNPDGGGGTGAYEANDSSYAGIDMDISSDGDSHTDGSPTPPTIVSVGACQGSECYEANEGKFTVNGVDDENLTSTGGSFRAAVKFFAYADSNQMPIRNVVVDWGDGDRGDGSYAGYAWPLDSQTGTSGDLSYYKNRRGLDRNGDRECDGDEWGLTNDACSTAYFSFEHSYYCSAGLASTLPACEWSTDDGPNRMIYSPCTGGTFGGFDATDKCVFQPRVHVKDNWGWCTGYCNVGSVDGTDECYDGGSASNECDSEECPGGDYSVDGDQCIDDGASLIVNPWINYDGVIIVDWAN